MICNYILFVLLIHFSNAAYLVPSSISTQFGGCYTVYLKEDNVLPRQCSIKDSITNITYNVNLDIPGVRLTPSSMTEKTLNDDINIITSLGYGLCGFKICNITEFISNWNITFYDDTNKLYFKTIRVIAKDISSRVQSLEVVAGQSFSLTCVNDIVGSPQYLRYCQILNPQNEIVMTEKTCSYNVKLSKVSDFGRWTCLKYHESSMIPTKIYYDVTEKKVNIVKTWKNETDTHVHIGCSVTNSTITITEYYFCKMVRPDGKEIILRSGLATERYTTIYLNPVNFNCAMEIEKPLEPGEIGLWRCENFISNYNTEKFIGGFINLSNDSTLPPPEIPKKIFTHENGSFTATCRVPYSSSYCYMRGPDSIMYPIEDNRDITLGLCKFTKINVKLSDNGTWYCGFSQKTGESDLVYPFAVTLYEAEIVQAEQQVVVTRTGGSAKLKCTTNGIGDYPLQYCRFFSPNGLMYHIKENETSDRINYYGRGFKYGDCGITINDITQEEEGIWSCITRIGYLYEHPEVYTNIHLGINDNLSVASVFGISFGVGIVVITIVTIAILKMKSRRSFRNLRFLRNNNIRSSNSSNSSANSGEVFNVNDTSNYRNYNTTNTVRNNLETPNCIDNTVT